MAKKRAPGKTVAEILRLAETPSILDADKPLPDLFERTRLGEVLEQTKAASDRMESPELQHWMQTGIADYERAFTDELARIDARAVFQSRQQPQADAPAVGVSSATSWALKKVQRFRGYSVPLYRFLAAAHREGKPRPSARDVIEEWQVKRPAEIAQVLPDGVNYYDSKGNTKAADLEAIRKVIERMTSGR